MASIIEHEGGDIYVLRISGTWKPSELNAAQKELAEKIDAGARPRLLAIHEYFEGWERRRIGTISIFFSRTATKSQESALSASRNGK